ncbi:MAG: glycosyltransferase [Bacillota bacterium]
MRIAEFTDTFLPIVDGVGRVVHNYAVFLSGMGHECYVMTPMNDTGYRGGYPFELVEYIGMQVPGLPQYRAGVPSLDTHYNNRLRQIQLDVVHGHSPFAAGREALRQSVRFNVPLIGSFHTKYYDDFYKIAKSEDLAYIGVKYVVEFYNQCDQVWSVSKHAADTLRAYGFKGDIIVLENGVPIRTPEPEAAKEMGERLGLGDLPVLLYVGQINWKKNILRTMEAASLLKKDGKRFKLVLVGRGPDSEQVLEKARELGIDEEVMLPGMIQNDRELNGLYHRASIFAFPSLYDTAGLVVREAAVMETPSLVIDGSAPSERIVPGINGLVCEDTTESMYEVLTHYLFNAEELKRLGQNARTSIPVSWEEAIVPIARQYGEVTRRWKQQSKEKNVHAVSRAYDRFKNRLGT